MYEEVFFFSPFFFLKVNRPQESRICMNGLFNYLGGCMGKKIFLLRVRRGGGLKKGGLCF